MNHIHKLQQIIQRQNEMLAAYDAGLADLRSYVLSSKFACGSSLDGYVNVKDILNRLESTKDRVTEIGFGY